MTEEEKPLTREDVLRLIGENGGTAKGLDLSGKVFEEGIDLRGVDLSGITLRNAVFKHTIIPRLSGAHLEDANLSDAHLEEAKLWYAHLEGADLLDAHLERAVLADAHLERALLSGAHLEGAFLDGAHLEGAHLFSAKFSPDDAFRDLQLRDAALEDVDWGSYILGDEKEPEPYFAEETYRRLKVLYTNAGLYSIAGEFFYREMEMTRKTLKCSLKPFRIRRLWLEIFRLICGYGERPLRVIGWAVSVVLGSALIYFLIGSVWEWWAFWNSLYFSAVSFTALGYGSWLHVTNDWIRAIGAFESFVGVFSIALFLVTFTRKMTR